MSTLIVLCNVCSAEMSIEGFEFKENFMVTKDMMVAYIGHETGEHGATCSSCHTAFERRTKFAIKDGQDSLVSLLRDDPTSFAVGKGAYATGGGVAAGEGGIAIGKLDADTDLNITMGDGNGGPKIQIQIKNKNE